MAGNDWYEKHKKDVAAALKKGRAATPDAGIPCTLLKMKDGSAVLCAHISESKVAAQVKDGRAAGGKVLSAGSLYLDEGQLTFAVSQGSLAVKALFASAAKEAMGTPMAVRVVAAPEASEVSGSPDGSEGTESEGQESSTPPEEGKTPKPTDPAETYRQTLAKLSDDLKVALRKGGPAAEEIKQMFARANALAQQKEYKSALVQLQQFQRRIADALADTSTPSSETNGDDLGLWNSTLAAAVKQIRFFQAELLKTRDPDCVEAAKRLEGVAANLKSPLDSAEAAEDLEAYVREEELITLLDTEKFFGVATDLRNSLVNTLKIVKKQLTA